MKRLFVLLVLSAACAGGVLPWWTGKRAEQQYQAYREQIEADSRYEIVRHEYRRGWFRSHAETVLGPRAEARDADAPLSLLRIEVADAIEHGPIPWSTLGDGAWTPVLARVRSELRMDWGDPEEAGAEATLPAVQADTTLALDGSATGRVQSPASEHDLGRDVELSWQGMQGQWRYEPEAKRVVGTFGAPGFRFYSEDEDLAVRGLEFDFDYREGEDGIPLGETRMAVAELSSPAGEDESPELHAEGLEFIHFLEVAGKDADTAVSARWERFLHEGETREGGYLQVSLSSLDAPVLGRILKALEKTGAGADAEADETPMLLLVPALLERAQLEVQLEFAEDAALQASASLDARGKGSPLGPLAQLVVELEASAATGFAEERLAEVLAARAETPGAKLEAGPRARQMLHDLRDRALIVSDGERYATRMRYRRMKLEVNGQRIDPQLLAELAGPPSDPEALPSQGPRAPRPGPQPGWPAAPGAGWQLQLPAPTVPAGPAPDWQPEPPTPWGGRGGGPGGRLRTRKPCRARGPGRPGRARNPAGRRPRAPAGSCSCRPPRCRRLRRPTGSRSPLPVEGAESLSRGAAAALGAAWILAPSLSCAEADPQSLGDAPPCESSALALARDGTPVLADNEVHKVLYRLGRVEGGWQVVSELPMPKKNRPKDIEALASSPEGLVVIGSHSRKSDCDLSKSRRRIRFLRETPKGLEEIRSLDSAEHLDSALTSAGSCQKMLFTEPDARAAAFCSAVVDPPEAAFCARDLNIEGGFVDAEGRLWLGFRWPLIAGQAAIARLAEGAEVLRFDRLTTLDLGGRGVRELVLSADRVYGLAGPARDSDAPFALWSAAFPFDGPGVRMIADDLPSSSEGLAILGRSALVVTDGSEPDEGERCQSPSRYVERSLPAK